jgi:hypothetical protein
MTINAHLDNFAGKLVKNWERGSEILDPENSCYAVRLPHHEIDEEESRWTDKFAAFLEDPSSNRLFGLVIGCWGGTELMWNQTSDFIVEALVAARDRLPNLRAVFLGDVTFEESEISWILQSDISPLFTAYPELESFAVRGARMLSLGSLKHDKLISLVIQSGGLGANVVREVAAADLPELEHLELWLGTDSYGGDATVDDLAPILEGGLFPKLKYLGLRNSEIADRIALAIPSSPIVDRIRILDLSMGTLGDKGAQALLASPAIAGLERLDIHYHYCSEEMIAKLQALGVDLDASDRQELDIDEDDDIGEDDEEYDDLRYVAIGE